ncbi:MAG: anaerobic glycerol-3-phosphate dehydrogenase subunit B [Gammaproteobacteria bacterium]|nr:anaerobic glycerol-3-phosphate dehydrogenase subunit B [Gammaproteobacteria bacterium]
MTTKPRVYQTQLAVIGSGLAGFAAAVFALDKGISTAQVGNTGAIAYTTGYLDLLGGCGEQLLEDPWEGLKQLRNDEPRHPLSRVSDGEIQEAFSLFTRALSDMGINYTKPGERNLFALSPAGTTKPTLSVPETMITGVTAKDSGARTLILDFVGLKGFSALELVSNLRKSWPGLTAKRLEFPGMTTGAQLYPEVMARALEVESTRRQLAEMIRHELGDAECVGMPAIMGIHLPDRVHADLQRMVGVPLFEIPTMPPAVPGIRLREMFEQTFPALGLILVPQQKVKNVDLGEAGTVLSLKDSYGDVVIETRAVLLATGRFLSGGLHADRFSIRESLLGIPVTQPEDRAGWYRKDYFDHRGHPVNRAGIEVDELFRPLDASGVPINEGLFAAGILLAHQDWMRQRCGAGVAIASAYKAVEALSGYLS